ncbi:sensor histidine kinase [Roseospira navarrensis]|uniref:histidine kinase n=2 Tax=Roseospira navarrensis TaxID=140058 RepID=A0A7X1ZBA3_9PROT|nr:sensor histidine kinase [Roseospira navarrensis]
MTLVFERHVERRAVAELSVHLDQIIASLDRDPETGRVNLSQTPADPRFGRPLSGLYWQVESDHRTNADPWVLRSRSLWDARLPVLQDDLADGQVHEHVITGPLGASLLTLERMVQLPERLGGTRVRTVVALDRADLRAATAHFARDLLPYLGVLALMLIGASAIQITVGLRPLAAIRARINAIRSGTASRLGSDFPSEVMPLATEVDALLTAREGDVVRARARAADLAHGLKTPLQVLAGDVDRLRNQGETAVADEIQQVATSMRRHVERELARARLAAGVVDSRCRPAEVVRRVVNVVRRAPDGARLQWDSAVPDDLTARMDADDLTEVLGNLIDNAARHAAGHIRIEGAAADSGVVLRVLDDGPGIPADMRSTVLDRGVRLDMASAGSGLGLAIAQDILAAWGGTLTLEAAPSGGLAAVVTLPVRQAAHEQAMRRRGGTP